MTKSFLKYMVFLLYNSLQIFNNTQLLNPELKDELL